MATNTRKARSNRATIVQPAVSAPVTPATPAPTGTGWPQRMQAALAAKAERDAAARAAATAAADAHAALLAELGAFGYSGAEGRIGYATLATVARNMLAGIRGADGLPMPSPEALAYVERLLAEAPAPATVRHERVLAPRWAGQPVDVPKHGDAQAMASRIIWAARTWGPFLYGASNAAGGALVRDTRTNTDVWPAPGDMGEGAHGRFTVTQAREWLAANHPAPREGSPAFAEWAEWAATAARRIAQTGKAR